MKRSPFSSCVIKTVCGLAGVLVLSAACSEPKEFEYVDDVVVVPEDSEHPNVVVTDENGNETTLPTGSAIGVYVVDENGNVVLTEVEVDEDGKAVLPASGEGGQVIAYTPYQEDWGDNAIFEEPVFTVETDQTELATFIASDFMIGSTAGVTRAVTEGGICFKHMMAKVAIHVVDETGRVDLSHIAAELLSVETSVQVNLPRQQVTTIEGEKADIPMFSEMTTDWRVSSYAIVAPQTVSDGATFFAIMLYGNRQTYPIPEAATLEGGKTYTINMRLTEHGLILDGWRVTDWEEENEQDINIVS